VNENTSTNYPFAIMAESRNMTNVRPRTQYQLDIAATNAKTACMLDQDDSHHGVLLYNQRGKPSIRSPQWGATVD
jgi:hypothetical protein